MNMMTNGTNARQRDIILIPFPYSDLSQEKRRPAIIISDSAYNTRNEDVICCAITSNPREYPQSVEIDNKDLDEGALMYNSRVKPSKIFTLDQGSIIIVRNRGVSAKRNSAEFLLKASKTECPEKQGSSRTAQFFHKNRRVDTGVPINSYNRQLFYKNRSNARNSFIFA